LDRLLEFSAHEIERQASPLASSDGFPLQMIFDPAIALQTASVDLLRVGGATDVRGQEARFGHALDGAHQPRASLAFASQRGSTNNLHIDQHFNNI
jgi:hypothetical protein